MGSRSNFYESLCPAKIRLLECFIARNAAHILLPTLTVLLIIGLHAKRFLNLVQKHLIWALEYVRVSVKKWCGSTFTFVFGVCTRFPMQLIELYARWPGLFFFFVCFLAF